MKLFHIVAGLTAITAGAIALYATKGSPVHRKSGTVFVYTMVLACIGGMVMSASRGVAPAINFPAALLTAYLALTALTTVRPRTAASRSWDIGAMLVAFTVGVASLAFGFDALASPGGLRNGMPAFPFFLFGVVGVLAAALDLRMIRSGGLVGAARLARHLWRMCFALFIASISFFIGQAKFFPAPIRKSGLLPIPVVLVLVVMIYWLARVLIKRARPRNLAGYTGSSDTTCTTPAATSGELST